MKLSEIFAVTYSVMLIISCSVKEDRRECPCRLMLDMEDVDTSVVRYAELVVTASDGFCIRDTLNVQEMSKRYVVDVERGVVGVGVYCGAGGKVDDKGRLSIDYGDDCPPVYMYSSFVLADGESTVQSVRMRKNHCLMTIQVQSEKDFPFRLEAKGKVDGYEPGGKPSVGEFMYAMSAAEDGTFQIALPRQTDDSLVLEVHDETGILRSFALGQYVTASGYDWREEDLKDLTVSLNYALTRIVISVSGWTDEYVFDVVI